MTKIIAVNIENILTLRKQYPNKSFLYKRKIINQLRKAYAIELNCTNDKIKGRVVLHGINKIVVSIYKGDILLCSFESLWRRINFIEHYFLDVKIEIISEEEGHSIDAEIWELIKENPSAGPWRIIKNET